ncbi:MAG: hypothetical protein ACE5FV_10455 [Woeseia sp.]
MNRKFSLLLMSGLAALLMAGTASANGNGAGIVGSPHDFSTDTWNFRNEICRVCHVPHDHDRNYELFANGLLWNHQLSAETYQMYAEEGASNPVFASFIDGAFDNEPTGGAKLCLGCHDGTVGIDQFDRSSGATNATPPTATVFIGDINTGFQVPGAGVPRIGTDMNLTGTHPLSIVYDEVADPGLHPKTNALGTGTIQDVLEPTAAGFKVQCSSCHDVHDGVGEAVAGTHLLRVSTKTPASGLCLTCHKK